MCWIRFSMAVGMTLFLSVALPLGVFFAAAGEGLAQRGEQAKNRGIRVVGVTTRQGKRVELYQGSHALLVGVSKYTAGWPSLESIPGEMDRLEAALKRQGFSVTRVDDPNSSQMEAAFKDFINQYGYGLDNRLLFFYSGHGFTRTTRGRRKGYLVPADAPNPHQDLRGFNRKALTMSQV